MRCCVPCCTNTADNVSASRGEGEGITFHSFPSEAHLRAAWLRALGKQDTHLPDSAVVCSQHFLSDDIYKTESGLWQVNSGDVPSTVQVCMICLDTDSKHFLMSKYKLEEAYIKLTGHPLYDPGNLKQTLCAQCAQRLINFSTFRDRSLRARSLMMDLVEKHELITKRHIKMINCTKNQLKCNFVSTKLEPDHWDLYIVEHSTEDKQPKIEDSVERVVDFKNEGYDCMLGDGDMEATNEEDNVASNVNIKFTVVKQEHSVSDDSVMDKHRPAEQVSTIQELLKCKSATYKGKLCSEDFHLKHEYNEHMRMHLQNGESACETTQVCDPLAAANPSCNSPHITEHKHAVQKLDGNSHHVADSAQTCIAPSPARLATSYEIKLSPAEEADTSSEKSERGRDVHDGDSDNQASGGDNDTNTNVDDFTNRAINLNNIFEKLKHSPKSISCWDSENIDSYSQASETENTDYISETLKSASSHSNNDSNIQFSNMSENSVYTDKKSFPCDVCGETFKQKCLLVKHVKTHTETKLSTCEFCPYKFKFKSSLVRHMRTHTGEKPYSCKLCEYKCATRSLLVRHMRKHTGEKPISCKLCEYKCAHSTSLVQHMRTHTGEKPYSCELCEYKSAQKANLMQHIITHTSEKSFSCKLCEYKCAQKANLVLHMRNHIGEKPYSCEVCQYKCGTSSLLAKHMRKHTGEKPYSCELCAYNCASSSQLGRHMQTHTGDKPYSCDLCEYRCAQNSNLQRHFKTHTGEKPYSCKLCAYRCARSSQLVYHMRNHTGEKPYSCELCKYKSAQHAGLVHHMRTHTGEKPYSCDLCTYKCAQKHNLVQHLRTHSGEKPYSCDLCTYKCPQKQSLVLHMQTHTGEKSYSCKLCEYKSARSVNFEQHMRKHTGEKPYSCELCGNKYARKANLVEHKRTHTGEKPYSCEFCAYNCATRCQLGRHVRTHTG